ncbi:hypothetical protein [Actinophytocola sp.]|uniref:hypothetical protein n=1 Tax=Actinophytocola sp. TaxID=1872138 RepID=UPI003D6ABE67
MRTLVLLAVAAVVAGCARAEEEPVVVPEVPQIGTTAPASGARERPVPQTCGELATSEDVGTIIGTLITGEPQPVVGVPQESIGRTARLDCYYGLPAGKPLSAAIVWIGVASYTDEASAQGRVTATITGERDVGARVNEVPVGQGRGVLLRGQTWMLVAMRGSTTVVVSVRPDLVREDRAGAILGQLADKALTPREPAPTTTG